MTAQQRLRASSSREDFGGVHRSDSPVRLANLGPTHESSQVNKAPHNSLHSYASSPNTFASRHRAQTLNDSGASQGPVLPQSRGPSVISMNQTYQHGRGMPLPPPPPLQPQAPLTPVGMNLPPPPPRSGYNTGHGMGVPGQNLPSHYWSRQQTYPPQNTTPQPYNPNAYLNYGASTQMTVQAPQQDYVQMSATYIPGSDSFGPGVGIPPLHTPVSSHGEYPGFFRDHNPYQSGTETIRTNSAPVPQEDTLYGDNRPVQREVIVPGRGNPGYVSPGPPTATLSKPQTSQEADSSNARAPSSPSDPASQWPLDRVILWLAGQGYTREWQETFKVLNIYGSHFLELGSAQARGSVAFMHSTIIPQLAREHQNNGTKWDQGAQREEGKKLRRAIRRIVENGGTATAAGAIGGHRRDSSITFTASATDANSSPDLRQTGSTPTTAGTGEDSPGIFMPPMSAASPASALFQRRASAQRGPMPNPTHLDDHISGNGRSSYAENALRHVGELKRASLSPSRELDPHGVNGRRQASPQSSPGLPSALQAGQNGARNSLNSAHTRGNSSEQLGRPRHGTDSSRLSPMEAQRADTPISARESKQGGLFGKWRSKRKDEQNDDSSTALESPTSPGSRRAPSLFGKGSNTAVTQNNVFSNGYSTAQPFAPVGSGEPRRFAFVTPDLWNYRLVDISNASNMGDLRRLLCESVHVPMTAGVSLHLTSPGQTEHDENLSDDLLAAACRSMADVHGTLKVLVLDPTRLEALGRTESIAISPLSDSHRLGSIDTSMLGISSPITHRTDSNAVSEAQKSQEMSEAAHHYRQDVERRQRAYLESRKRATDQIRSVDFGGQSPGIRREGQIDFDKPRKSPYEQRERELVPKREPPPVPPDTSTLIKANSLTKKSAQSARVTLASGEDKRRSKEAEEERGRSRPNSSGSAMNGSQRPPLSREQSNRQRSMAIALNAQASRNASSPAGSPRSPSFTMSKGSIQFQVPEYEVDPLTLEPEGDGGGSQESTLTQERVAAVKGVVLDRAGSGKRPSLTVQTGAASNPALSRVKGFDMQSGRYSPDVSPSSQHPASIKSFSRMVSQRGPRHDFTEAQVDFASRSPAIAAPDSDDDSDDGLFAVKIRQSDSAPSSTARHAAPASSAALTKPEPTPDEQAKGRAPSFSTPVFAPPLQPNGDRASSSGSPTINFKDAESNLLSAGGLNIPLSANSATWSPDEPSRFDRRESFASDVWANRPPAEALVEHLDEFFPNVNLDQPVNEEDLGNFGPGLDAGPIEPMSASYMPSRSFSTMSSVEEDPADGIGSLGRPSKMESLTNVAQRNLRKANGVGGGGLGRTKSIREVVKDAYQHQAPAAAPLPANVPGPARVATLKSAAAGAIVRRKSTKMFGAKIEQVKPQRGSRLMQLETIPQDMLPVTTMPARQQTFKWVKGQLIGKGTFGRVYLGMNMTTGELIAVKQVEVNPKAHGQDKEKMKEMVKSLDIEIDTMKDLDHPNIVSWLGSEKKEMSISIFLEYIPGGSVGSCLRKHGKFEESVVSSLTRQTLSALAYLHREGILHRDLKADNILLDLDGTCKISDFGISKKTDDIYGNDVTNSMQGSVFWMAPEVIRSQGRGYSAKVDIWSLGCVVLEMFAGRRPWSKEEAIGAIYKLGELNQAPPIPDYVSEAISPGAISFMYDCFTIDSQERPTADTLLRAPFCFSDPRYNFLDSELYSKIRGAF